VVFVVLMLLLTEEAETGIGNDETAAGVEILIVWVRLLAGVISSCCS
jgi:hypothetical protein